MAKECVEKGCRLITGTRVKIRDLTAYDLIVDASGHPCQTDLEFGRRVKGVVAIEAVSKYEVDEAYFMFYPKTDGYIWIFPKKGGIANIGLGYYRKPIKMKETLKKFLNYIGAEPIFWTGGSIGIKPNFPLVRSFECSKIALVGDAAGLADLTGQGMTNAVISSRILSYCLIKNSLNKYERLIKRYLMPHILFVDYVLYRMSRVLPLSIFLKYFKTVVTISGLVERLKRKIGGEYRWSRNTLY